MISNAVLPFDAIATAAEETADAAEGVEEWNEWGDDKGIKADVFLGFLEVNKAGNETADETTIKNLAAENNSKAVDQEAEGINLVDFLEKLDNEMKIGKRIK